MSDVLITGVSSGLGQGLAEVHLARGDRVLGVSRRAPPASLVEAGLRHQAMDLTSFEDVAAALGTLLDGVEELAVVYLNAGVLGSIQDLGEAHLSELKRTLDVNLWGQKAVLDGLQTLQIGVDQVVAISSGASVAASRGWSGYALSKAALNMMVQLYAAERPDTHLIALAPGLVDTSMQAQLAALPREERFAGLDRLRAARGTPAMPGPAQAAARIVELLPTLRGLPSGGYADVRTLPPVGPDAGGPLAHLDRVLPAGVRGIVERKTAIPSIALRAAAVRQEHPELVRADIGQISGFDPAMEVLYGPPVGLEELRALLAESWNLAHGISEGPAHLGPANVCITTGAAEGLSLLFQCFARGKTVAVPRGHWENYRNGVELAGGRIVEVDFFDAAGALDLAGLAARCREEQVAVLVANFPCNPTGAVLVRQEAEALGALVRELGLVCVADEVYDRLRYDGHPPLSLLPFAPDHTVAVSSASKEYLLPGARVGYVMSAHRELTDTALRKLVRSNTASPNVLGQRRLLELLRPDLEDLRAGRPPGILTRVRDEMGARRDRLVAVLESHGMPSVGRPGHRPAGTIFLMARVPDWFEGDDEAFAEAALEGACVSTVPGSAFGLPGSVRFSYGGMTVAEIEKLDRNLTAFRDR